MARYTVALSPRDTGLNWILLDNGAEIDRYYSECTASYAARMLTRCLCHVEPHRAIRNRVQPNVSIGPPMPIKAYSRAADTLMSLQRAPRMAR